MVSVGAALLFIPHNIESEKKVYLYCASLWLFIVGYVIVVVAVGIREASSWMQMACASDTYRNVDGKDK